MKNKSEKYPSFPKDEDKKTLENIIRQYPKTNDCEIQTLGELRHWQITELNKLFSLEKNKSKELWIAAKQIVHLHLCEQEGIGSGQPTPKQWLDAVDKLYKALHEANPKRK